MPGLSSCCRSSISTGEALDVCPTCAAVKEGTKWRMAVKDVSEPAKAAGIQKHDILLAIEDTEILDAAHLKNYLIERTVPGQRVSLKVRRAEADLTFTVILAGG